MLPISKKVFTGGLSYEKLVVVYQSEFISDCSSVVFISFFSTQFSASVYISVFLFKIYPNSLGLINSVISATKLKTIKSICNI